MRTVVIVSWILASLLCVASPGQAQPDPGDVWVTFDTSGATSSANPPAFVTTNEFYVVTYDVEIAGYEFALSISDPNIIIFAAADETNPGGSINVSTPPLDWSVGVGLCTNNDGGVLRLVHFTYGFFVASVVDVMICIGPSDPSSLNPPMPAYLDCSGSILPFGAPTIGYGYYPPGCGVLWPTNPVCCVATDTGSWGSLKSRF